MTQKKKIKRYTYTLTYHNIQRTFQFNKNKLKLFNLTKNENS